LSCPLLSSPPASLALSNSSLFRHGSPPLLVFLLHRPLICWISMDVQVSLFCLILISSIHTSMESLPSYLLFHLRLCTCIRLLTMDCSPLIQFQQAPILDFDEYESIPTSSVTAHLLAGAFAGIMEHCVMYPMDSVKVRNKRACTLPVPRPTSLRPPISTVKQETVEKSSIDWFK